MVGDEVVPAVTVGIGEVGSGFRQTTWPVIPAEMRGNSPVEAAALGAVCSAPLEDAPFVRLDGDTPPLNADDSERPPLIDDVPTDGVLATLRPEACTDPSAFRHTVASAERAMTSGDDVDCPAFALIGDAVATTSLGDPERLTAASAGIAGLGACPDPDSAMRYNAPVDATPAMIGERGAATSRDDCACFNIPNVVLPAATSPGVFATRRAMNSPVREMLGV
jgi:hypothetical protein